MIKSVFYTVFDINQGFGSTAICYDANKLLPGPKVLHQVPAGSITTEPCPASAASASAPASAPTGSPLIDFASISPLVIPRQNFCSHALTILASHHRIVTHPICLSSPRYPRNEFLFALSLVLAPRTDATAYSLVATKLAALLAHLEIRTGLLSRDLAASTAQLCTRNGVVTNGNTGRTNSGDATATTAPTTHSSPVFALCEILLEDLNNYGECMIPLVVDDRNSNSSSNCSSGTTLNLKLFPTYPPPPPRLSPHHVPLATARLDALADPTWDATTRLVLPRLDGVASVATIARAAHADTKLVGRAVAHLLYYGCATVLDAFSFAASYAPTPEMGRLLDDADVQLEGVRYIVHHGRSGSGGGSGDGDHGVVIDGPKLVELYASLRQGQSLHAWCMERVEVVRVFDVRRLVTFGVIKGFLYRVHKYAYSASVVAAAAAARREDDDARDSDDEAGRRTTPIPTAARIGQADLRDCLDGTYPFDEICTAFGIGERELMARLRAFGDVQIIHK